MVLGVAGAAWADGHAPEHNMKRPDPGVVVTYGKPTIRGKIDTAITTRSIKADNRAQAWCFKSVAETVAGGLPDGTAALAIDLDATGKVTGAAVTGVHTELAACLQRRVEHLTFMASRDKQPAHVAIDLAFKKKPKKK